jgi:hypothetical protein
MARYIISHHRFHEHSSARAAAKELQRLQEKHPGRDFRIYQVRGVPTGALLKETSDETESAQS